MNKIDSNSAKIMDFLTGSDQLLMCSGTCYVFIIYGTVDIIYSSRNLKLKLVLNYP